MDDVAPIRDREPGTLPGIPHPGAIVAFAAAVFAGTLLAAFSAMKRSELGGWWMVAMAFALTSWLAVAVAAWLGKFLSNRTGVMRRGGSLPSVMIWLLLVSAGLLALVALVMSVSPLGMVLSALPFLAVCAFFWARRIGVEGKVGVFAGVVLFLICIRLFTMSGDGENSSPSFAGKGGDDLLVMSWNVAGGAPSFSPAADSEIGKIAKAVTEQGAQIVCLQGVPSARFLQALKEKLGAGWRGECAREDGKSAAVLSRIGGIFQSSGKGLAYGGPCMVRIASDAGVLNFVSCQTAAGRDSSSRRRVVDWAMKTARSPTAKTVIAGDFAIDPERGWSFLQPLLTDSARFDKATWRAINILGSDPGFGGAATTALGRRVDWVLVDSKMSITDYRVLESLRGDGIAHAPVVVRLGLGKAGRAEAEAGAVGAPRAEMLEKAL